MKNIRHKPLHYNALHYVLIILMMFAPLRGVMAMQQTRCDMNKTVVGQDVGHNVGFESASFGIGVGINAGAANLSSAVIFDPTLASSRMSMSMHGDSTAVSGVQDVKNTHHCCSGNSSCVSVCDMSISVSLLIHESTYTPNFTNVSRSVAQITNLIKREVIPPFRPPLVFHN